MEVLVANVGSVGSLDIWPISAPSRERVREEKEVRAVKARVAVVKREERVKEFTISVLSIISLGTFHQVKAVMIIISREHHRTGT